MPRTAYNKNALHKQRENLRLYERILPSLDLKRMQVKGEHQRAKRALDAVRSERRRLSEETGQKLPMLANRDMDVSGLVKVEQVVIGKENIVGVRVPVLREVRFAAIQYGLLARPAWVDDLVVRWKRMIQLQAAEAATAERVRLLERAERRITQRVNLFEKILIPRAKKTLQAIRIVLADGERSAVVRSKLTKSLRRRRRQASLDVGAAS